MKFLDNIKITRKLTLLVGLSAAALVLTVFLAANSLHHEMVSERVAGLKNLVEVQIGTAEALEARVKKGEITRDEAFEAFRHDVDATRYGDDGNYLAAVRLDGRYLAFPPNLAKEGVSALDVKDGRGRLIIRDMIDMLRRDVGGSMQYLFPKVGSTQQIEKVTYFKKYGPW